MLCWSAFTKYYVGSPCRGLLLLERRRRRARYAGGEQLVIRIRKPSPRGDPSSILLFFKTLTHNFNFYVPYDDGEAVVKAAQGISFRGESNQMPSLFGRLAVICRYGDFVVGFFLHLSSTRCWRFLFATNDWEDGADAQWELA